MHQLPAPMPLSENGVRERANRLWGVIVRELGADYLMMNGVSFDEVYEAVIYPRFEIDLDMDADLGVDDDGIQILGQFLPRDNAARISRRLVQEHDPRKAFTCWHEVVGHGVLQGDYLRKTMRKHVNLFTTETSIGPIVNTFEHQANVFAANVAAPLTYIYYRGARTFGCNRAIRFVGPGYYCIGNRKVYAVSPRNLAWHTAKMLRIYFGGLSTEALAYQVLRVFVDQNGYDRGDWFGPPRGVRTIGELIADM